MSVQDLIIPGRRVWHHTGSLIGRVANGTAGSEWITMDWTAGEYPRKSFLPVLSADEVRNLPVGAVLVDTLTGEDVKIIERLENLEWADGAFSEATWRISDRDLGNRFALKSYGNEGEET